VATYRWDITSAMKAGANDLEIQVYATSSAVEALAERLRRRLVRRVAEAGEGAGGRVHRVRLPYTAPGRRTAAVGRRRLRAC